MIIDDEIDYCQLLKHHFTAKGVDVTVCNLLSNGLRELSVNSFHFIILDNNLPDGYGWDHAQAICASHQQTKVILISAHPHRSKYHRLPASAEVREKPVSFADLNAIIQNSLR